jgi:hypothetical protein
MNQDNILSAFDALAAQQPAELIRRLRDAGLPDDVHANALRELMVALSGIRLTLTTWTPRPPLQDAQDRARMLAIVAEIVASELAGIAEAAILTRDKASVRARTQLQEWNRGRPAHRIVPTAEQRAAMTDKDPTDYDTVTWEDLGNGKFRPRYSVKPDIIDWTSRR